MDYIWTVVVVFDTMAQHYNNNNIHTHTLSLDTHTVWMIVEWEDPPKSQKIPWRELGFLRTIARK